MSVEVRECTILHITLLIYEVSSYNCKQSCLKHLVNESYSASLGNADGVLLLSLLVAHEEMGLIGL